MGAVQYMGCCCALAHLSQRDVEVIALVAAGATNRVIGRNLAMSEHTVANEVQRAMRRVDAGSRAELAARCYAWGVLDGWPPHATGRRCIQWSGQEGEDDE